MQVIHGNKYGPGINKPTGIGLGNFDGLHTGHMVLINKTIEESCRRGLSSVVYTFTSHPENVLHKERFTPLLTTVEKKIEILEKTTRLDYIYFDEFDEEFSTLSPEEFVARVLVERLGVRLAVAGYNYTFGHRGQGNIGLLKELGRKYNFDVIEIPPVMANGEPVSSTLIRKYVAMGNMDKVCRLLGRHYSVTGTVVSGHRIGSKLGFPTANLVPEDYLMLPGNGVYVTRTLVDGECYRSVTNIGVNPTVESDGKTRIETHIFDFDRDIYGRNIEVFFIEKLRDEIKFKNVNELVAQVELDIQRARNY